MLVIEKNFQSISAEAYRTLRNNIQYSSFDKKIKTILITSAKRKEGKSTICGNTAMAFAKNDEKVLLIDCDLRNPSVHTIFNIANEYGLSEVLLGNKKLEEVINHYDENLDIITSGTIPPNPSEMIESKSMERLLEQLEEFYDLVILDSSPVTMASESQVLSRKVDGTILVARKYETKINEIKETKELIENVGGKIIGGVFNCIENPKAKNSISLTYNRLIRKIMKVKKGKK